MLPRAACGRWRLQSFFHEVMALRASTLVEAMLIHPVEGGYQIELVGEIAGMVEIATGSDQQKSRPRRAALDAEERRSVKLVAGARFELTTFRL
jgi:hypothetical protein